MRTFNIVKFTHSTSKNHQGGFALVIALSLMAFVLLLLLAMTAMTRVEQASSATNLAIVEARSNAILGLNVAIGQLQKYAGADQRVTVPATTVFPPKDFNELYDGDSVYTTSFPGIPNAEHMWESYRSFSEDSPRKSTDVDPRQTNVTPAQRDLWDQSIQRWWNGNTTSNARNPHWVGVFDSSRRIKRSVNANTAPTTLPRQEYTSDPDTLLGEFDRNQLPVWLISGNEQLNFDPLADTAYPTGYHTPEVPLPNPETDDSVVWLVGKSSAAPYFDDNGAPITDTNQLPTDGLTPRIKAPKVEIANGARSAGHYAYWVGDESTKANFTVREREDLATATPGTSLYRSRLQVPQRIGWENIEGFAEYRDDLDVNSPQFDKIFSTSQIGLISVNGGNPFEDDPDGDRGPANRNFHSITSHSKSLLTDTALGGLKKDLTRYLLSGSGLSDNDSIADAAKYTNSDSRLGSGNSGFPGTDDNIPTWGEIRGYYQNSSTGTTGAIGVTPGTAPIMTNLRFHIGFSYDSTTQRIQLHYFPLVTLWNSYSAPLESTSYQLEVRKNFKFYRFGVASLNTTDPDDTDASDGVLLDSNGDVVTNADAAPKWFVHDLISPTNDSLSDRDFIQNLSVNPFANDVPFYQFIPFNGQGTDYTPADPDPASATWITFNLNNVRFEAGESLVFTVGSGSTDYTDISGQDLGNIGVDLVNEVALVDPASFYFDVAEFPPGIGISGADTVRVFAQEESSYNVNPGARLTANGSTLWENFAFGAARGGFDGGFIEHIDPSAYAPEPAWKIPFIIPGRPSDWRELLDINTFIASSKQGDSAIGVGNQSAPLVPMYNGWLEPLTPKNFELPRQGGLSNFYRAFGPFNLTARSIDHNLSLDGGRADDAKNNSDSFGMLSSFRTQNAGFAWASTNMDEYSFNDQGTKVTGYVLTNDSVLDGATNVRGLESFALRAPSRIDSEILSIGQLQQANIGRFWWQPSFVIGNSEASPYVDREALAGIQRTVGAATIAATFYDRSALAFPNDSDNQFVDLSYLMNENIWDRYFLSTIPNSGNLLGSSPIDLENSRHVVRQSDSVSESDLRDFDTASAHLENVGALNVNSTSVEAWKSVLSAFLNLELEGAGSTNPPDSIPIARNLAPIGDPIEFTFDHSPSDIGATGVGGELDYSTVLNGFRYLDDSKSSLNDPTMLEELAQRIVDEVRLRGPFFSVADFVNRRLILPDKSSGSWDAARSSGIDNDYPGVISSSYDPWIGLHGIHGPLQRAIALSGINGGMNYSKRSGSDLSLVDDTTGSKDRIYFPNMDRMNKNDPFNPPSGGQSYISPAEQGHYLDTEHLAGAPVGERGNLFYGTPGFITQGDLLSMIGPALTARGDTFVIRSYGDSLSSVTGKIRGRAWLEAVVQRIPQPVSAAGTSGEAAWQPSDEFGRKFEIISIRWLSENEI